jgi:gallate dioxygenase
MARIIGGLAASHTPTIGFALDRGKQNDPVWAPIFENFAPLAAWLEQRKPDAVVIVYNDHVTSFFFDHYSAFALGIGERYEIADEGGGQRILPPVPGHAALSHHIGAALMAEEFDMAFFQGKPLDHGATSPLSMLFAHETSWPVPIVPLQVGVLQFPIPSARRCYKLGQALRRAIESFPQDIGVAILATGGLSHQVHGERAGFNNTDWDHEFLHLIETDPEQLTRLTIADYARRGGMEGAEIIMWLVMRGALSPQVRKVFQSYYLPSVTAIATAIYEDLGDVPDPAASEAHRAKIAYELDGADTIDGTYPFTYARSAGAFRANRFLHGLVEPAARAEFLADPSAAMHRAGLSADEQDMIRRRDWRAMIHAGFNFFMLEKLAAVCGIPNPQIYAGMRGETLEAFLQTRNAPGALYSVAGGSGSKEHWNRDGEPAG